MVMCLCFVGTTAHAMLSSRAPMGIGAIVAGCCPPANCAYSTGRIATPTGVTTAWTWFSSTTSRQIKKTGQSWRTGQSKVLSSISKNFESQNKVLRQILTSLGVAEERMKNMRQFGTMSAASSMQSRENYMAGRSGMGIFDNSLREKMEMYLQGFEKNMDRFKHLQGAEKMPPGQFFPEKGTHSVDQTQKMYSSLRMITDAFPATNSTQNENYRTLKNIKQMWARSAISVLTDVMSGYAPTIPVGKGITKMYRQSGGSGEPPQIKNGRMSPVGYLSFLVNTRFANDNYRVGKTGLHAMTKTGILRELAAVQALRMAIERRELRRVKQIAFLTAQGVAEKTLDMSLQLEN